MPGIRPNILSMAGYVPGEQPQSGDFVKLNTNENPYPPSPRVFEAIRSALTGDRLRKYPEPMGDSFRQVASSVLKVPAECILIGNGSDDILTILTRAFVPEGGLMVSLTPSYILYRSLAEIQGARFQTVPFSNEWDIQTSSIIADADVTFIANPNSPSGTVIPVPAIHRMAHNTTIVVDEAYADFADDNALRYPLNPNVIITRTLSKSYALAGIRFGFAVASPEFVRELVKVKDSYNCDILSLAAASAALSDQEYLADTRGKIISTRRRMAEAFNELGFNVAPSQANFIWAMRDDRPLQPIYEQLKAKKILVRYMKYAGHGDGLRVSVGTDAEIDRLLDELRKILAS